MPDTKKTTQCQALVHVAVSGPCSDSVQAPTLVGAFLLATCPHSTRHGLSMVVDGVTEVSGTCSRRWSRSTGRPVSRSA